METLPNELLVQTALFLPSASIHSLSATSRSMHSLIFSSIEIQAHLACIKYGAHFHPSSQGSLDSKLKHVEQLEKNWRAGTPSSIIDVPLPGILSGIYDLCGGHYLVGSLTKNATHDLPLRSPEPAWRTTHLHQNFVDLGLSIYEHDLVCYVKIDPQPHAINLILHLVQFSTNLAHPEAREPMLLAHSYSPSPHWHAPQVSIELVGEFLVLGIANMTEGPQQEDKFVVYAWRTGECKMLSTPEGRLYGSPIIISPTLIALLNIFSGTLDYFPLTPSYFASVKGILEPRPVFRLALPTLSPGSRMIYYTARCEPNPSSIFPNTKGNHPKDEIVMTDWENALATIYINIIPYQIPVSMYFALYVHRSTLLRLYEENYACTIPLPEEDEPVTKVVEDDGQPSTAYVVPCLPWGDWGERWTKMFNNTFPRMVNTSWITTSSGRRAARYSPMGFGSSHSDDGQDDVVMMDHDDHNDEEEDDTTFIDEDFVDDQEHLGLLIDQDFEDAGPSVQTRASRSNSSETPADQLSPTDESEDEDKSDEDGDEDEDESDQGNHQNVPHGFGVRESKHKIELLTFLTPRLQPEERECTLVPDAGRCFAGLVFTGLAHESVRVQWDDIPIQKVGDFGQDKRKEKGKAAALEAVESEDTYDGVLIDEENLILVRSGREVTSPGRVRVLRFA